MQLARVNHCTCCARSLGESRVRHVMDGPMVAFTDLFRSGSPFYGLSRRGHLSVFSKFDRLRQSVQRVVTDRAVFLGGVAVLGAWYTGMMVGGGTKGTGMLEVRVTCILDKFFCPWTHCECVLVCWHCAPGIAVAVESMATNTPTRRSNGDLEKCSFAS